MSWSPPGAKHVRLRRSMTLSSRDVQKNRSCTRVWTFNGTSAGVPESEATTYVEAVRRGGALVMVQASPEQADMGIDILHGRRPGKSHTGQTQWQYVDNVGVVSRGDPALHTIPGTADASGFTRFAADFREHQRTTATESGLTYMEY